MNLRAQTADDDAVALAIHRRLHPYAPPILLDTYRHWVAIRPAGAFISRVVADIDNTLVGRFELEQDWHSPRSNVFWGTVEVDPRYHFQGIGSILYAEMSRIARHQKATLLYGEIGEMDQVSLSFSERRGFARTGHLERQSRLDVSTVTLPPEDRAEERLAAEGIRITTLAEFGEDQEFLRALHNIWQEARKDMPTTESYVPSPYDIWRQRLGIPGSSFETIWVAVHQEHPIGLAHVLLLGEGSAHNGFTGVARTYRGKGVAFALKRRLVQYAREHGIRYIYTGNAEDNHTMLAINRQLGYQPLPGWIEVILDLTAEQPTVRR